LKKGLSIVCTALILTFCLSSLSFATPQSLPNGPWVEDEQNVSLSSVMTNAELYAKLARLEAVSKGKMELEIVGYSDAPVNDLTAENGYPLYLAKFGGKEEGKVRVFITTQIHGNEVLGTEAAVELMQKLVAGGKEVDEILDKVSIWIMPRINPDGSMYQRDGKWYPIRQCLQAWDPTAIGLPAGTKAPWYYNSSVKGYDQNRDYNPNTNFRIEDYAPAVVAAALNDRINMNNSDHGGFYVNPEARIVTSVFREFEPDVYFDIHHRGFNALTDEDIRSVSIQVAADVADPYFDEFSGEHFSVDDNVLTLAKQVNALGWMALQKGFSSFGAIQKYPKVNLPGTALGAFALNDTSIMLIEIKGQTQNLGQKQNGMLKQTVKESVFEILKGLADGSVYEIDPAIYDAIPESDNRISDPSVRDDIL